jgi:cellulose synthase/poly-beta-1,6-N-acetylglucosamine synthase-like glycosyltransferase
MPGLYLGLLLDADTVLAPGAVRALVTDAARSGADLVSGVTRYAMGSRTERALMPGFPMLLLGFLPLGLLARTGGRPAALAFADGPLMLVRRDANLVTGGHAAIAGSAREDIDLARLFARAGRRIALIQTALETLVLQTAGLLADLLGGPRPWHGRTLPSSPMRPSVVSPVTSGSTPATKGIP